MARPSKDARVLPQRHVRRAGNLTRPLQEATPAGVDGTQAGRCDPAGDLRVMGYIGKLLGAYWSRKAARRSGFQAFGELRQLRPVERTEARLRRYEMLANFALQHRLIPVDPRTRITRDVDARS